MRLSRPRLAVLLDYLSVKFYALVNVQGQFKEDPTLDQAQNDLKYWSHKNYVHIVLFGFTDEKCIPYTRNREQNRQYVE